MNNGHEVERFLNDNKYFFKSFVKNWRNDNIPQRFIYEVRKALSRNSRGDYDDYSEILLDFLNKHEVDIFRSLIEIETSFYLNEDSPSIPNNFHPKMMEFAGCGFATGENMFRRANNYR